MIWEGDDFKKEVNAFLGALCQRPSPQRRGTAARQRKKSTSSLVPCVSARPHSGEGHLLGQGRSQRLPWCLASAARPRKKSTPSLVPCISARPHSGEGQLLGQGRSQRLPWCLASAPVGEGQLLGQGRSQHLPWCLASAPVPTSERDSCSAKEEVNAFLGALHQRPSPQRRGTAARQRKKSTSSLVPCVSARPHSGEGQLLGQGRNPHRKIRKARTCLLENGDSGVDVQLCEFKVQVRFVCSSRFRLILSTVEPI